MFKDLSPNRLIISFFYLFLLAGLVLLYMYPKPALFLHIYEFHSPFFNLLMRGMTTLGNGLAVTLVVIFIFFIRIRAGFYLALSTLASGVLVQILKVFVFPGHFRPVKYFADMGITLEQVPGVNIHLYHSFPSGHTTSAFALWFGISLIVKNKFLKWFFFLLAIGVGYSRIYLAQHFPEDVLAGAVIGGLSAMIFLKYTYGWKKEWLNKSLSEVIKK